ncbi:M14 family metallopeptidase [Thiohalobacter sp. IOR34]|uniref:M14 family metallopeptidase n=1 Tax=Thiohalobacter sp. IOR34 TaxID=3057176 RepID=UPI0025AF431A|nr:M14 family metallopeptidase [Thiohalobacter sp. IOR34]WJW75920.1 M14 family metallopeptidase [Thiohalobacter sp. IOR34]
MLQILESLPEGLLQAEAGELLELLGGPTLLHLPGRQPRPLFVSVLLHGNEDTGFCALRELLRAYQGRDLPRALSVFLGNLPAAARGLRRLEGQPDYNRVWPGSDSHGLPEHAMMRRICEEMERRQPFAAIDVHNNTGLNPHYACINRIDHRFLHLATLFSRTVVYFTRPRGVASQAFARLCPAVTVECGRPGQEHGVAHARDYLDACLHLSQIPVHPVAAHDVDLFHSVVTVKVPAGLSFGFGQGDEVDIDFLPDLDHLNFRELPAGTALARVHRRQARLEAWNERGRDVGDAYFRIEDGQLRTRRPVMPSMFTLDARVVRQDCLGYLMERYELM